MITNQSIMLARWWIDIVNLQDAIENSILPVGVHLHVEHQELLNTLEDVSQKIKTHLESHRLQVIPIDG